MKTFLKISVVALVAAISYAFTLPTGDAGGIQWMTWDEAVEMNEKNPRPVMIDVYTDWCGWCKKMDATTFANNVVASYVNENFYAVKMDGEYKQDIVYKGRTYKFVPNGRRGYHELPAELMNGRMSYPTIVFLNENMDIIQPLPGYRTAPDMEKVVKFIGSKAYKDTKWETFSADNSQFELSN